MASPQVENGHIRIANELGEALAKVNLSPYESRVLWVIIRHTYGWTKKFDRISYSQFEDATGLKRRHLSRALNNLLQRNIISRRGNGYKIYYGLQKNYESWRAPSLPVKVTIEHKKPTKQDVLSIFKFWNGLKIIDHDKLTPAMETAVMGALKTYGKINIMQAMTNYAQLLNGDYEWTYKWTLQDFLTRGKGNNIERFKDMAVLRQNYGRQRQDATNKSSVRQIPKAGGYTKPEDYSH